MKNIDIGLFRTKPDKQGVCRWRARIMWTDKDGNEQRSYTPGSELTPSLCLRRVGEFIEFTNRKSI